MRNINPKASRKRPKRTQEELALLQDLQSRYSIFDNIQELDYFVKVPSLCNRLRMDLRKSKDKVKEWESVRNVCIEHVRLQSRLVDMAISMKKTLNNRHDNRHDSDDEQEHESSLAIDVDMNGHSTHGSLGILDDMVIVHGELYRNCNIPCDSSVKTEAIIQSLELLKLMDDGDDDARRIVFGTLSRLLSSRIGKAMKLGEELCQRILRGVTRAFELTLQHPKQMVMLTESVSLYERIVDQYRSRYQGRDRDVLYFTDMKSIVMPALANAFKTRMISKFDSHLDSNDDNNNDNNDDNHQHVVTDTAHLASVLEIAAAAVSEIHIVKTKVAKCFPSHWDIDVLFSSCVSEICYYRIVPFIGGSKALHLEDLTLIQVLDLLTWVEYFQAQVKKAFPDMRSGRIMGMGGSSDISLDVPLDSFNTLVVVDRSKAVGNVKPSDAMERLLWAYDMLSEVQRLAQADILTKTTDKIDYWLDNIYNIPPTIKEAKMGRLMSNLSEDVFFLVTTHIRTLQERLDKESNTLIMASCIIFSHLHSKQYTSWHNFLQGDLRSCCAAANDFYRMSATCRDISITLLRGCDFRKKSCMNLRASASELCNIYVTDAIYAARTTHLHVFEPIRESFTKEFFGRLWEKRFVRNELAVALVKTLEDYVQDLEKYLNPDLMIKAVEAMCTSTVVFYVECLVARAKRHKIVKGAYFKKPEQALERMMGDIDVFKDYFNDLAKCYDGLSTFVDQEFQFLIIVHEIMRIAAGLSSSDISDFILIIDKKLGDQRMTKKLFQDLLLLVNPIEFSIVWNRFRSLETQMKHLDSLQTCPSDHLIDRSRVPGLTINEIIDQYHFQRKTFKMPRPSPQDLFKTSLCCKDLQAYQCCSSQNFELLPHLSQLLGH